MKCVPPEALPTPAQTVSVQITSPGDGDEVSEDRVSVTGNVMPANAEIYLLVNGSVEAVDANGVFEAQVTLSEGVNVIEIIARDPQTGTSVARKVLSFTYRAPTPPDFSAVRAAVDRLQVQDMAVMIGDSDGILFSYTKGDFTLDEPHRIASASKFVTGLTIWQLVEDGTLSRDSQQQDFIGFWDDTGGDPRADVTLDQLLGFTSGFDASPGNPGCIGNGAFSIEVCVREIYDAGQDGLPGQGFYYGPEHMQIAVLMAEGATGESFQSLQRRILFDPAGISSVTGYRPAQGDNPRYSASLITSVNDYGLLLQGILQPLLHTLRCNSRPRNGYRNRSPS